MIYGAILLFVYKRGFLKRFLQLTNAGNYKKKSFSSKEFIECGKGFI